MNDYVETETGERIYFNPSSDSVRVAVGGDLPNDVAIGIAT